MNKQEFQQTIKNMKHPKFFTAITINEAYEAGFEEAKGNALFNSCFLNEPEKSVVPQFVADWYEKNKDDLEYNLYKLCIDFREQKLCADLHGWFNDDNHKCIETLVKMKLYGYEVEKEKMYVVFQVATEEYLYTNDFGELRSACVSYAFVEESEEYHFTQQKLEELNYWKNPAFEVKEVKK